MIITCNRHRQPEPMASREVGLKDGRTEAYLFCPRCWQSVKVTPELQAKLDAITAKEQQVKIPKRVITSKRKATSHA